MVLCWRILTHDILESTQNAIINAAENGEEEGLVIRALKQSQGRGRHGRQWEHAEGNLSASFLLRPACNVDRLGQISLLMGLSLHQTIERALKGKQNIFLKWPNDVLIQDKKCAGVLIESSITPIGMINWLAVGFGVNIKSAPLDTSCCLSDFISDTFEVDDFLTQILENFKINYEVWKSNGFQKLRQEWLSRSYRRGHELMVKVGSRQTFGLFENIDEEGGLVLLNKDSGERFTVPAGEVFTL